MAVRDSGTLRKFDQKYRSPPVVDEEAGEKVWYHNARWYKVYPLEQVDGISIWERLPRETPKGWLAFQIYRDLGPDRTMMKVTNLMAPPDHPLKPLENNGRRFRPAPSLRIWQIMNHWNLRVIAYDRYVDEQAHKAQIDKRIEMIGRHAEISKLLQDKIIARLKLVDSEKLSPQDIARWFELAVKVDRLTVATDSDKVDISEKITEMARKLGMDPNSAKEETLRFLKGSRAS